MGLYRLLLFRFGGVAAFHLTAAFFGAEVFNALERSRGSERLRILEVGSQNVNGELRSYAPSHWEYVGVDLAPGDGVDLVLQDPYHYPFQDGSFDLVVSSSAVEHMDFFWLGFMEMLRVCSVSGHVVIMAPSTTRYHGVFVPPDSWRFLQDAGGSLLRWAAYNGEKDVHVLQSFVGQKVGHQSHEDAVMIFARGSLTRPMPAIPTAPPPTFTATMNRISSSHRCWRLTPEVLAGELYHIPRLQERVGFSLACCHLYEVGIRPGNRSDALSDFASRCWEAKGRSYEACCPYIMTD
eukprot:TRINITY_DN75961_c0_g1_i1.p1 TRINITY_DN75961_c0_g1~~TRINITY_DN75961_c0_g1_i1.p1  ORF type:complete len:294 (-),score=52.28 TRINITY_DN75961_c0_g1_i1:243-1124(-)